MIHYLAYKVQEFILAWPSIRDSSQTHCKWHGTDRSLLPLSEVDILYKLRSILIATYSVGSYVSIKAMVHGIPPTCVWGWGCGWWHRDCFRSLNTMYSLTLATIIWMIYGVSLAVSHSAASWRHMVGTPLFCLAFRQGRAVIKNSVFCWLPLNVCPHFYFMLCAIPATGYWMRLLFFFTWYIVSCPIGGGRGSEERGEWSGPGLPVTSSDRHWWRPAQHWNHPVLLESK